MRRVPTTRRPNNRQGPHRRPSIQKSKMASDTPTTGDACCAEVGVFYGTPIKSPPHIATLVKHLALWKPPDAMEPKKKRSKHASTPLADDEGVAPPAEWDWSDVPDDIDANTQKVIDDLRELVEQDAPIESDLWGNVVSDAFHVAARRLFETDDLPILLSLHTGCDKDETIDADANDTVLMLRVAKTHVTFDANIDQPFNMLYGIPFGCGVKRIPSERTMKPTRAAIEKAIKAFGLRPACDVDQGDAGIGWQFLAVADWFRGPTPSPGIRRTDDRDR